MRFTITTEDTGAIQVSFSECCTGKRISVDQDSGGLTIRVEPIAQAVPGVTDSEVAHVTPVTEVSPVVEDTEIIDDTVITSKLFERLVTLRKQISSEVKLPAYMVFHDSTLKAMCQTMPDNLMELKLIPGVGAAKLDKYGSRFLEVIRLFKEVA
jgi:superfamily II DNA helicase RecQ